MAYPWDFTSITMNGTLAGGNEIFSAGFHVDSNANRVPAAEWRTAWEPIVDDIATRLEQLFSHGALRVPADAQLTSVKFAHIGTDGKYLEEAIEVPTNASGNLNSGYAPQVAMVSTLVANKFKDPGKYNRFYLPIATGGIGEGYRLSKGYTDAYAAQVADALADINGILATGLDPYFAMVAVVSSAGAGHTAPVVEVKVGGVYDTQRRRRNKLNEDYSTSPVVAP